jgi:hypothetical protein
MFHCLNHGWMSTEKPCPACKTEKTREEFQRELRRDRGGARCSMCGVREAQYGRYCGSCAGDMDL